MKRKAPKDLKAAAREAARRGALRALAKVKRAAAKTDVALSEWEGEFLGSVEGRVKTYGRAFADPDKGQPGQALSMRQRLKLKQIAAKAEGEAPARPGFRRRPPRTRQD